MGYSGPFNGHHQLLILPGYKFETLSVLPKPWANCSRTEIESRETEIVNNHAQYISIVRTGIGSTTLVLAGEVDAILGAKPSSSDTSSPIPWIELKTSAEPQSSHPREALKFERKLLRFWAQSFLLGVPKIMVGFRTPDGLLTRIEELDVQRLPGVVKRGAGSWDGIVCINFAAAFLGFVQKVVVGEGVWRIRRRRGEWGIEVFRVEEEGTGGVLGEGFKAWREKLRLAEIGAALGK